VSKLILMLFVLDFKNKNKKAKQNTSLLNLDGPKELKIKQHNLIYII